MARRLFDFKCNAGHTFEKLVDVTTYIIHCPSCSDYANRQLSAPTIPVGVMGPNWATDRAKKQAKEKRVA